MLLNLDAGELPDESEDLWRLFDVLAIACGGHAGDARSMARVLAACATHGIRAAAHPSYADRDGFGRRTIAIVPDELAASIETQCVALGDIARAHGVAIEYIKPHGALYHDAARDPAIADAVLRGALAALGHDALDPAGADPGVAARDGSFRVIGPARGALLDATLVRGLVYLREGFADRGTRAGGSLIPRGEPGALITDPVAAVARARSLAADVETVCVHADTPNALAIARAVREALRG